MILQILYFFHCKIKNIRPISSNFEKNRRSIIYKSDNKLNDLDIKDHEFETEEKLFNLNKISEEDIYYKKNKIIENRTFQEIQKKI